MTPTFRQASESDLDVLFPLMRVFYAHEHLTFDDGVAAFGLRQLFEDPSRGAAYLVSIDGAIAGYFVLAFNFSLEFHGRYAWIDELYIVESLRGRGAGVAVLQFVEALCRERGLTAVRLEVARRNTGAERLYRRSGYEDLDRDLLTKWLR